MKKISLYIIALLATFFTACNEEDYSAPQGSQSNKQESALQSSAIKFNSVEIPTIDLNKLIKGDTPITLGTVSVEGDLPANTAIKAKIEISKQSTFSDSIIVEAESMANSNDICVLPSTLQAAYYNNFTHNPNQATIYLRIGLYTITNGTSEAYVGDPSSNDYYKGNYTIAFTPIDENGIYISNGYYAVAKNAAGDGWVETKFIHGKREGEEIKVSEADVYDDPIFIDSVMAVKNENDVRIDTEFYIVAEEDLAKFKEKGDKKFAFGKGEGEAIVKGGPAFVGLANDGASKYRLTINMEKQTVVIETIVDLYYYYIFGVNGMKPAENETARNYMFYKTKENVFNYTTKWPNSETGTSIYNLKVAEHKDFNVTGNHWGTPRGKQDESGNLTQKSQTFGPKTEGWYTLTITMNDEKNIHTYQWTAINEPTDKYTEVSIIGNGLNEKLTECAKAEHNWYLLGYTLPADTQLKFRADTKEWGGDGSQPIGAVVYTLPKGDQAITVPAGTYDFYFNDITGDWSILKVEE